MTMTDISPRLLLAYEPTTGRIVHAHFTDVPATEGTQDSAEEVLRSLLKPQHATSEIIHLPAHAMAFEKRYRVDPASKTLVEVTDGSGGFSAGVRLGPSKTASTGGT
jgi:hypothetical protein